MVDRVLLPEAGNRTLTAWRVEGAELVLRFKGDPEERLLQCVCGRNHWIVREQFGGPEVLFAVRCHHCGRTGAFPMEGFRLPPR